MAAVATLVLAATACGAAPFSPDGPMPVEGWDLVRNVSVGGVTSSLWRVNAPASTYATPPLLVDLRGASREAVGYAYGRLLGNEIRDAYSIFITKLIGSNIVIYKSHRLLRWRRTMRSRFVLGQALDWQWASFLSRELPVEFKQELEGIEAGAKGAGAGAGVSNFVNRITTLANAPGDVKDFALVLVDEWKRRHPHEADVVAALQAALRRRGLREGGLATETPHGHCSMFGVWGSRTEGGQLFTGRNLDWNSDTGINKFKIVTVFHPPGVHAHATVGFVGVWGALTGMSSQGLTVHEANLEEDTITFDGFPWLLRLRWVMENAANASEAVALWKRTNNTVGFNHMVGFASEAAAAAKADAGASPAVVMETMAGYTAFFGSMDPREASATYSDPKTNASTPIGFPLPDAVWRTNHGYDPTIRRHFEWSQAPSSWSNERYRILHDSIAGLEARGVPVTLREAVNITAVVGDKGHETPFQCQDKPDGSNVISVAFQPAQLTMAAAWERSTGDAWRPACCSSYLLLDMNRWFSE